MRKSLREIFAEQRMRRIERQRKPWSKRQKIISLSILGGFLLYCLISYLISEKSGSTEWFSLPNLNLSIKGFDVAMICLLASGIGFLKLKAYLKQRKEEKK